MAIMIPQKPIDVPQYSREDEMFIALENLTDEYYVFHSFRIITNSNDKIHESETDFVIFHPDKGIMCIEAKAGKVTCKNDIWYYGSGIEISHGGPYKQADRNKWKLAEYFKQKGLKELLSKCKLIHAVWFPAITRAQLNQIAMTAAGERALTLTSEDLKDPSKSINDIFDLQIMGQPETKLTPYEKKRIVDSVLCPSFDLLPLTSVELDNNKNAFARMLKEQSLILNFLEEQPFAVINGGAGTGKTLIAVEKARRHAAKGEKVLFLCFNKYLCTYLRETFRYENVGYYTIDAFACLLCDVPITDFPLLQSTLEDMYLNKSFPYDHVIIDEGQDFGQDRIIDNNIVELLEMIVLDEEKQGGTFYIFYDKNQLIQGSKIPQYIVESDCKLTLYKNCRNTENIAITSQGPLRNSKTPKMITGSIKGDLARIYIESEETQILAKLNQALKQLLDKKITDIVILTCETEERSILNKHVEKGVYTTFNKQINFTTCRKFKGLEADAVILIDVKKEHLIEEESLIFYVGASRARFYLDIICEIADNEYAEVAQSMEILENTRFKKSLGEKLNTSLQ